MATEPRGPRATARLLDCDPALGAGLAPEDRAAATEALAGAVRHLSRGPWQPDPRPRDRGHLGYLIFEGLLVRRVVVGSGSSAELLGKGDLLWPWDEEISSFSTTSWEVLAPCSLLVLGPRISRSVSRWPPILSNLVERGTRRSRALAADAALASVVGIADRVLILLWQIAERWGELGAVGVKISIRLPHRIIAELVGARRPSVTSALAELQQAGRLGTTSDGSWVLLGDPPSS
jgi:hypothetical protein